ncbi:HlyD family secretion protein [Ramlibacter sp.]|uniref:efflux RND transporter periplasmic adaptor subunit n=1 Tax=Ramlibacter sp. TaxID=1917967 RepID=UPI002609B5E8|nr:HlyD family secretion protein [Ramlibacter sp.]MDB5954709.1 efflux transporter, subunit [Ramlibacter sp.]
MTARTWAAHGRMMNVARALVTLAAVAAASWAVLRLWDHYELAPWTRDGRVRASVVQIAPDVSGLVSEVPVHDNQTVRAGDALFNVDPARYELAVRQAEAAVAAQRIVLAQALREDRRSAGLADLISQETREQTRMHVDQARAGVAQGELAVAAARLNLQRAQVKAPVAGIVTNLDLRAGGYASAGRPVLALVDMRSLYVEGYFEETKLRRIRIGDRVRVQLMAGSGVLAGTVDSIAAGIADRDRSTSADLLPNVNPTFNWVRLAQRVPVRVRLDPLPADLRLVAGETVSVEVMQGSGLDAEAAAAAARAPVPAAARS